MSALRAIAELYRLAVSEGALTGDPTLDAATIAASMPGADDEITDDEITEVIPDMDERVRALHEEGNR